MELVGVGWGLGGCELGGVVLSISPRNEASVLQVSFFSSFFFLFFLLFSFSDIDEGGEWFMWNFGASQQYPGRPGKKISISMHDLVDNLLIDGIERGCAMLDRALCGITLHMGPHFFWSIGNYHFCKNTRQCDIDHHSNMVPKKKKRKKKENQFRTMG